MIIAVDFDGTVIERPKDPGDLEEVWVVMPGAREALSALKVAEHTLILTSCRANLACRKDWRLNPLWKSGQVPLDKPYWAEERAQWEAGYRRMVEFVAKELPDVFDAIDDGEQGKVLADLYLDDKGYRIGFGSWAEVAEEYGMQEEVA